MTGRKEAVRVTGCSPPVLQGGEDAFRKEVGRKGRSLDLLDLVLHRGVAPR